MTLAMMRSLVLLGAVSALAAAQPAPARVRTQYTVIGRETIDTSHLSAAFQAGLVSESLVRIQSPLPDTNAVRQGGDRLESSPGWISLECSVFGRRAKLRTFRIDIITGSRIVMDSALAVPLDSLPGIVGALGRSAAHHLRAVQAAAHSPG